MVESAPSSPVKTPTKTTVPKKSKTPTHPSYNDMVLNAVNTLTLNLTRGGVSKQSVANYIAREYEIENRKNLNNSVMVSIEKLKEAGTLIVTKGDILSRSYFKLEPNFRKKLREKPTQKPTNYLSSAKKSKEAKKPDSDEKPVKKTTTAKAKTPVKNMAKKKTTPKKPAAKKPVAKKAATKTAKAKTATPKKSTKSK